MLPFTKALAYTACLALPTTLCGQVDDLAAANAAFMGQVTFKIDKHQRLVADHFDGGLRSRQDIGQLSDLDPATVSYSEEEDAVVLKCLPDKPQCLSKEIFKLDVLRLTSRITLPRPSNDEGGALTMEVLRELITAKQAELQQDTAETPMRPSRKRAN